MLFRSAGQVAAVVGMLPTNIKNGNGINSIAGGINSIADYNCDFTFGEGLSNTFEHQTVFGKYNDISDWGDNRPLFMIGNGTDADHRSNAFEVRNNGLVVVGNKVQQLPDGVADGFDFTGKNPNATALDATLTGTIPYGATGEFANAFGGKCAAQGKRSHAEGTTTIAKGKYSHAEGDNCVTLGADSHAEGYQTVTGPNASAQHAEGMNTQALGMAAHSEGSDTIASGNNSHAGGWKSEANSNYSFVHGAGLKTHRDIGTQSIFGSWNSPTQSKFIIGAGSQDERKNLFEVRQNGDICMYYGGKMYSLFKIFNALNLFNPSTEIDLSDEVAQ